MRKALIAGNWKMNGQLAASSQLVAKLVAEMPPMAPAEMLICPPLTYLAPARQWLGSSSIRLGAQNLAREQGEGAFTGEVSGAMLRDVGCDFVIVGHSERRALYGETSELVAAKFVSAQAAGLVPIVCVGETLDEREAGATLTVVGEQLRTVLDVAGVDAFASAVVAYEPVWAIGTGRTATPEQAQEIHAAIRAMIADRSATIAAGTRILYGGSMKPANAAELLAMTDIDGGLIGGAALEAAQFLEIFRAALG